MAHSRRELLDRWLGIQEEDIDDDPSPSKQWQIRRAKETWFADCFNFLNNLPKENHIWCGFSDLMGPLLETFHNYYNDKGSDSPLKVIWKRLSLELGQCIQCIFQHHHAQESYNLEYEADVVGPLLKVLRSLDEERVAERIVKINARMKHGENDADTFSAEVICIMLEVLTYPVLLEAQFLVNEFQVFLEAVDACHDVTLAGSQQYPGVYALLFLKSGRTRAIGFRLAQSMRKLRSAADLDPLQPLLKKYIGFLETEVLPLTPDNSRPRLQLERTAVWIGVKTLLGFLEAPAYEDGILEKYPVFLSIVLNYVSGDTLDFSYAVACLRISFEILGSKLWLRTALSPSVMRNTLLGQCFHTRNEKSHKEIFDLFLPFLQSLEAHLDGEHEKQRRNLLYFLLHQVTQSSNFSDLMRKNACKIAFLIVHRGYKMVPPCPPFECAHMWGPTLVNYLKNFSLHSSLRQPAFDLITTIIISDASALISLKQKMNLMSKFNLINPGNFIVEEDEFTLSEDVEEKDSSCWNEFNLQSKLASSECISWSCVPMLWIDSLIEVGPAVLPISFSKALFWVLSRISVQELSFSVDMSLSVLDWFSIYASEIPPSFGWQIPTGFDDGGEGKESKNSVKASTLCIPLLRSLKRISAQFILQLEKLELHKQWTWEPRMAESLILSLVDPDDAVRKTGKIILEHFSHERLLTSGLQFLCSSASSLSAVLMGLRFLFKQVQDYSIIDSFHSLHHVFFVSGKLLKEIVISPMKAALKSQEYPTGRSLSSQGGFLLQPFIGHIPASPNEIQSSQIDRKSWEKFSFFLSSIMWSPVLKCLVDGKEFMNNTKCQMTCVRLLEALPAICERLSLSFATLSESVTHQFFFSSDFKWLLDLLDWGRSHLVVVIRHWKQCMQSLLNFFKVSYSDSIISLISTIENFLTTDTLMVDHIQEHILSLMASLSRLFFDKDGRQIVKPKSSPFELLSWKNVYNSEVSLPFDSFLRFSVKVNSKPKEKEVVVLSDDEFENVPSLAAVDSCCDNSSSNLLSESSLPAASESILPDGETESIMLEPFPSGIFVGVGPSSEEEDDNYVINKTSNGLSAATKNEGSYMQKKDSDTKDIKGSSFAKSSQKDPNAQPQNCQSLLETITPMISKPFQEFAMMKQSVQADANDPLELALEKNGHPKPAISKPTIFAPKRKVIQLQMPENNKIGLLNRMDISSRRLKPPRLDIWYKSILELNYFVIAGLHSENELQKAALNLNKIPLYFKSSDHYVQIFQPLVLEEFKAQLHNSFLESSAEDKHCGSLSIVSVERINDFHMIRGRLDEKDSTSLCCMENDLVLLTKEPLDNFVQHTHLLGKVERREKSDKNFSFILVIRLYIPDTSSRLMKLKMLLIERSNWFLSRIMSITPQLREFQALSSLNTIPMLSIILNPADHSFMHTEQLKVDLSKLSQSMQDTFMSSFNVSQLQAISAAIRAQASKKFELSLIQGPPGTGKTRTIVAIVSVLLVLLRVNKNYSINMLASNTRGINALPNLRPRLTHSAEIARSWQDADLAKQLLKDSEKESSVIDCTSKGRVLICAQSNAAVDELMSRINEGLYGNDGKIYKPFIVRVGNAKTVHPNSLPFFIDTLVELRLVEERNTTETADGGIDSSAETSSSIRAKLEKVVERIQHYESKRAKWKDKDGNLKDTSDGDMSTDDSVKEISDGEIGAKLSILYREKKLIYQNLASTQVREKKTFEENKALKYKIRKSILREAEIVVTTLSGCGGDLYGVCYESTLNNNSGRFTDQCFFDVVIIDEAAQALEPATLIPLQILKSNGAKCIMVGDPKQLPATVLSSVASQFLYECSMFERLQRAGHPVILLTEQYRMHPEICSFPSWHFYDKKLLNGVNAARKSAQFHEHAYLGPYMFFDINEGREHHGKSSGSLSLYNEAEVESAVSIMRLLRKRYSSDFNSRKIGIITPYKSQLHHLRSQFSSVFGSGAVYDMEFNTVDGFQGREVDILILTTVRSSVSSVGGKSTGIGFVADLRRMNVALTRAKISLWIFGNAMTLQKNNHWAALVQNAKERSLFISVSRPYDSFFERSVSSSGGSSCPSRHAKKISRDKSIVEVEQDRNNDIAAYRKKTNHATRKSDMHSMKKSGPVNPEGNRRLTNDKNKLAVNDTTAGHEGQTVMSKKKKDGLESSGSASQKNQGCSKGGSKAFPKNVQLNADSHLKTVVKDKGIDHFSGHVTSKMNENITILRSSKNIDGENNNEKIKPLDNKTAAKDLLASRKRRRDDIEALLPSALISSKKTGVPSYISNIKKPPRHK